MNGDRLLCRGVWRTSFPHWHPRPCCRPRPSTHGPPTCDITGSGRRLGFPGPLKPREISRLGPGSTFDGRAEHRVFASFPREACAADPFRVLGISAIFSVASPIPEPPAPTRPPSAEFVVSSRSRVPCFIGPCPAAPVAACITRSGANDIGINEGSKTIGPFWPESSVAAAEKRCQEASFVTPSGRSRVSSHSVSEADEVALRSDTTA